MPESLIHVSQPTDLVMVLMQFTHLAPWNQKDPLMIYDDYCEVTVRTPEGDRHAECIGYISFVTLKEFQRVVAENKDVDDGGPSVRDDLKSNLDDNNAVYVLPDFVGEITGTTAGWHDWDATYVIDFPPNTKIEPVKQTRQRLV